MVRVGTQKEPEEEGEYRGIVQKAFGVWRDPEYVTVIRTGMTTWAACARGRGCGREGNADNFGVRDSVSTIQARFWAIQI
jgi:hypothetical protein